VLQAGILLNPSPQCNRFEPPCHGRQKKAAKGTAPPPPNPTLRPRTPPIKLHYVSSRSPPTTHEPVRFPQGPFHGQQRPGHRRRSGREQCRRDSWDCPPGCAPVRMKYAEEEFPLGSYSTGIMLRISFWYTISHGCTCVLGSRRRVEPPALLRTGSLPHGRQPTLLKIPLVLRGSGVWGKMWR